MKHSEELFCTPFCCPERLPTPLHPSPNSELCPTALERQKARIEEANEFLRTIGNPRDSLESGDSKHLRALQLRFRQLRGLLVRVIVEGREQEALVGGLEDAGRDFLTLDLVGEKKFVRYSHILEVVRSECDELQPREPELIGRDTCSRRNLVLDFGRTVAGNAYLINLFFGIPLHVQLLRYIGCEVEVKTIATEDTVKTVGTGTSKLLRGKLFDATENEMEVQVGSAVRKVSMDKVVYVTV